MHTATAILAATTATAITMIKDNLRTNDHWLYRAILAIYDRQTRDEQTSLQTKHNNSIGFNGIDGGILSSFAQQIQRWTATNPSARRYQTPLSPAQTAIARAKMSKYAGQLLHIARAKAKPEPHPLRAPDTTAAGRDTAGFGIKMLTSGYRTYS